MEALQKLKILNLTKLAELSKVSYQKIYFRATGYVKEDMTHQDRTRIVNAIYKEIGPLFEELGFELSYKQKESIER